MWAESFLLSIISALSGVSRHLFMGNVIQQGDVWAAAEAETGGVFTRDKER